MQKIKSDLYFDSIPIMKHLLFCWPHSQFTFRYLIFIGSFASNISLQYWWYRFTALVGERFGRLAEGSPKKFGGVASGAPAIYAHYAIYVISMNCLRVGLLARYLQNSHDQIKLL